MKNRSLQLSIILGFTLLIIITILTIGPLSSYLFNNALRRNSLDNTTQVVSQLNRVIDNYISYMDDISRVVIDNNDVQNYMRVSFGEQFLLGAGTIPVSQASEKDKVVSFFGSIISVRKDIDSIVLLLDNKTVVTDQPGDQINPYAEWLAADASSKSTGLLTASLSSSHVQDLIAGKYPWVITLSRAVLDQKTQKHRGTLLVNLNYSVIEGLCSDIQLSKSGYVFIINSDGEIVYHPQQQLIYSGLKKELIEQVKNIPNGNLTANVDGREVLYTTKTSMYTGWTVVGVSYLDELFYNRSELEYYIAMIAVACFFGSVIISYFISVQISRPIEVLRRSMQSVERGNFDIDIAVDSTDEVNGLAEDFNIAIRKIKELITQNALANEQKREHELKALQAQINPHFLYNTLDSIIWMIECGENEDAIKMTSTLAKFFRLGISKGGDIITVQDEIDHLNSYLTIQKMRYKDKLDYLFEVDPQILPYSTLKLLIQPLVENAIYHGLKNKDGIGMLKVIGYKDGADLVFKVIDNGIGMTSQELSELDDPKPVSTGFSRVGIANVRERIQLHFGKEYGVTFESTKGDGTVATIRLPAILRVKHDNRQPLASSVREDPMKREKRWVITLAIASLLVALAITVVYRVRAGLDNRASSKPRIAVVLKSIDYNNVPFWGTVRDGIELASRDFDVDFILLGPLHETQVDEQIRIIHNVIPTKPDAIVLAADDYDRLVPLAREIKAAHIPLVTIDSFINSNDADTKIGTNNYAAGQKAGAALMEYLGSGSRIVIMSYVQGTSTAIDRESGVRDFLKGKVQIIDTFYSSAESDIAYQQAIQLLRTKPDVNGIIALNDPTTIGAARALNDSGRAQDVVLIGFDNSQTILGFVEAGVVRATIVQRPFNMGYLGIKVALDLIKGKKVDSFIDTGSQVIDRQNMLLPENQKLLFPVTK